VYRDLNNSSDEMILVVNDASIRREHGPSWALLLGDTPPVVGAVCGDVGQIVVNFSTNGTLVRHGKPCIDEVRKLLNTMAIGETRRNLSERATKFQQS
jgi:hypothetical protein